MPSDRVPARSRSTAPTGRARLGAALPRPDRAQGVFETLRVVAGRVQALDAHLGRLRSSVRELYGQPLPPQLVERLLAMRDEEAPSSGVQRMRVDVEPRAGRLCFWITLDPVDPGISTPLALAPVTVPGGLGAHKWRDRSLLDTLGADPVPLLVDTDGTVLEAAWANVWALRGRSLITPPADGRILAGVTRSLLLERAAGLGLQAQERPLALDDLRRADAVVLTSSVRLAVAAALGCSPACEPEAVARLRGALTGE